MTWFSVLLVNVLLTGAVVYFLVRRIERRIQPTVVLEQIRTEVNELIVEFNQTTDRNVALLEERIGRLNQLIEKADRRVAVLRREIDSHRAGSRIYSDIAPSSPGPVREREPTLDEVVTPADPAKPGAAAEPPALDRRAQILDLYDKGIASNIIAARVGTTVGEVELIVSLTQRNR